MGVENEMNRSSPLINQRGSSAPHSFIPFERRKGTLGPTASHTAGRPARTAVDWLSHQRFWDLLCAHACKGLGRAQKHRVLYFVPIL